MRPLEQIKESGRVIICESNLRGGMGTIHMPGWSGTVVWSTQDGWEHVSVAPKAKRIMPSWDDMCRLKDMFFEDEECVIQYHPPKSEYVNLAENCLHLWKPANGEIPLPPSFKI